ncbi:hypothetical protein [Tabrizicola sp.]|uniref:hypothetical protein n=1 Tax=Tabrizicola sp. TaxID=2005166 RepID=UPI001A524264|nr:hypothetical protein [Tabrizicola sp.]MBL9072490.1 hypothetical protein [Tabrizicola sp.]
MIGSTLLGALLVPSIGSAEGFQVDADKEGLRKFGNEPFFSELAVGEEAYAYISSLCVDGSTLKLVANMPISSLSEYGYNLKLKREVNNSVTGQVVTGSSADASRKANWFSSFGDLYQCDQVAALVPYEPTFLLILSIDGFTDLKSLMRSHFKE